VVSDPASVGTTCDLSDWDKKMEDRVKQAIIKIVGKENYTESLIDLVSYSYDASDHDHRPEAAVWPITKEQISAILILANNHRFPITPRGAGTGLAGAAVPARGGVVLDLCSSRMAFSSRRTRPVGKYAPLAVTWPPMRAGSEEQSTASHGIMCWDWKWCCPTGVSCTRVRAA